MRNSLVSTIALLLFLVVTEATMVFHLKQRCGIDLVIVCGTFFTNFLIKFDNAIQTHGNIYCVCKEIRSFCNHNKNIYIESPMNHIANNFLRIS